MSTISTSTSIGQSNVGSYSWPITVSGSGTTVRFTSDLTFSDSSQYFVIGSDGVTIDGSGHTVTIDGVINYYGLIQNGTDSANGYADITVQNINMAAVNSILNYSWPNYSAWLCQSNYSRGAINNIVINCHNSGQIGGQVGNQYGQRSGGLLAFRAASYGGYLTVTACSNSGYIGTVGGGIFGPQVGIGGGTVIIENCYNSGIVGDGYWSSGGIIHSADGNVTITNCYNVGTIRPHPFQSLNKVEGITGDGVNSSSLHITYCYSVSGKENWTDAAAQQNLSGTPPNPFSSGTAWTSLGQNTPYLSTIQIYFPEGSTIDQAMYAVASHANYQPTAYVSSAASGAGQYSVLYVSIGSYPSINASTGALTLGQVIGTQTVYVYNQSNNQFGIFTYTNIYDNYYTNVVTVSQAVNGDISIDGTLIASWPYQLSTAYTWVKFTSDLILNDANQYFQIGSKNIIVDGQEHTVTIDGVNGYPGLVNNNSGPNNNGYSNVTIQNINTNGTSNSYLSGDNGWICQFRFATSSANNYVINCHNNATISSNGCGGICGSQIGHKNGSLTAISCYNSGYMVGSGVGGIFGSNAGYNYGFVHAIDCYNTANINSPMSGGIFGTTTGNYFGTVTIENCYNTGTVGNGSEPAGGIIGMIDSNTNPITVTNCYNAGTIMPNSKSGSGVDGLIGDNNTGVSLNLSYCYSVNGMSNWIDASAQVQLLGAPAQIPGTGSTWTSLKQNTPFFLESSMTPLPQNIVENDSMYSPSSYTNSQFDYNVNILTPIAGATYSVYYVSDGTATSVIPINPSTGAINILATTFPTAGTRTIYVICTVGGSYIMGYFTYTNLYTQYFNDIPLLIDQTFMDNVAASGTPYVLSVSYTRILFTSDLNLNNASQYFNVQCNNLIIDGQGHTVTIDDVGYPGYPGLIQNGTSGFNSITVQNIHMAANRTILSYQAGWIGQAYFGSGATNNNFINCSNSANSLENVSYNKKFGSITGAYSGSNSGNVTATNCSNTGILYGCGDDSPGGIFGSYSGSSNGNVVAIDCFNTGDMLSFSSWLGCGGIFGAYAGSSNGKAYATNCYNTGSINGNAGGIFGGWNGVNGGNITVSNCYNTGEIDNNNGAGGIFGHLSSDIAAASISNCYSIGILTNPTNLVNGIISSDSNYSLPALDSINCYVVSGAENWSDVDSSNTLLGGPSSKPGSGSTWTSLKQNTPFLFSSSMEPLPQNITENDSMYSPSSYNNDVPNAGYTSPSGSQGIYSIIYISDGTDPTTISIDTTGTMTFAVDTFASTGTRTFYVLFTTDETNYQLGYFTYTNLYSKAFVVKTISQTGSTISIDGTAISSWPVTFSDTYTWYQFTSDLSLNDTNNYFIVNAENIIIDGFGHTVMCNNMGNYNGFINNNQLDTNRNGFSNLIIQNINIAADSNSYLSTTYNGGGWIGQGRFGGNSTNNLIINCHNSAQISNGNCGGIVGCDAAWNSGNLTIRNCSNSGAITSNQSGGICGAGLGYISGIVLIENCYNAGAVGNGGNHAGGIIGHISQNPASITVTNCYNVGTITPQANDGTGVDGLIGTDLTPSALHLTYCYSVNGKANWRDASAQVQLLGAPAQIPGSGTVWTALDQNKPFYFTSDFLTLPSPISGNNNMYSPNTYNNSQFDYTANILTPIAGATYSVYYVSDGTATSVIPINPSTGSINILATTFPTAGTRTIYVICTVGGSYIMGYFTYTNLYTQYFNDIPLLIDQTFMDNVAASGTPYVLSESYTRILFTSDLNLNNPCQYFNVQCANLIIDGSGHTVTIDGIGGYPGLIQNGTSDSIGFNTITVQNINIAATNGSSLAVLAGWIGQAYFGQGATNNYFTNCTNSARIDSGGRAGGITGAYTGYNHGNVTATKCSNTGEIIGYDFNSPGGIFGDYSGYNFGTITATDCFNTGNISGWQPGCGGIFGSGCGSIGGNVYAIDCYNTGAIGTYGGGIFGHSCGLKNEYPRQDPGYLSAYNCYNTGNMTGNSSGGIFGYHCGYYSPATIVNCYNTGTIGGSYNGGICGQECCQGGGNLTIQNCYNTGSVDTANNNGGILVDFYQDGSTLNISNCYSSGVLSNPANLLYGIYGNLNVSLDSINCYVVSGLTNWSDLDADTLLDVPTVKPGSSMTWTSFSPNTPFLLATTVTLPTLPGTDIYYSNASMYTPTSASNDPNTNSYTTSAGSSSKGTYNVLYVSDGTDPTAIQINASSGSMSFGPSTFKTNGIKTIYVLFTVNGNPRGGKYFIGFFTYTINNYVSINQDYIDNANTNNLWPITFSESNTFISFTVNLTLNNSNQYFVIGANNITIDGQEHTVTIDGVNNYPGLIQNGTSGTNGYANITVQNIHIAATNGSALTNNGGWIGQTYFGQAALNNNFINCSNSGSLAYWCGGIIGAYGAYNGGHLTATNCYNTGNISGESAGGIFSVLCGNNGGYISAINCYNTGSISGKYAGGIFGNSCVADYGTMYVINCYNTGSITGIDAGGIVGNYCAHNSAILQIANCYNSGNVMENSAGGIFGAFNNYPNASISNCYNSGTIVNSNTFNGIFSSNNSFSGTLESINCYSVNGPANWLDSDALVDLSGVPASVPGTGSVWTAFGQNTPFLFATYSQIPAGATLSEMYTVTSYTNPDPLVYTGFASTEGDGNYSILYVSDGSTHSINQSTGSLTIYPVIGTIKIIVYNQTTNHISMFTYTGYYAVAYMPFYIDQSYINNNQTWPIAITSPYTFVQFTSNLVLSDSSWYISIQCDNVLIDGKDKTVTIDGVGDYPGLIDNHNSGDYSNITVKNINMLARNGSSLSSFGGWIGQRYFGQTAINISFINCTNTALVIFAGGGICGSECSSSLTVTKCSNHGDIQSYAGGIVGFQNGNNNAALNISFCYNTGNLIEDNAGGIIGGQAGYTSGWGSYINITDCYNTGSVNNTCGGIIGQYMLPSGRAVVTVTNCYNQGTVADGGVGIIAYPISNPEPVVIRNCYSSGNISDLTWGIVKDSGVNVNEYYVADGAANWSDASAVETIIIPVPFAIGQILPMSSQQAYSFSCCISATGQYLANCNDDNKSIMFSSNYGNTWSVAVSNGRNRPNTVCCSSDGKYFYGNVGVGYKSTDYGATWTTWTINSNYYYIICDASGKNVYAQTDNHIGYSHDYGNTWSTTSTTNLPNYNRINILYVSKSGQYVYASTSRANIIYKSSDYGQSYNVINNILVPPNGNGETYYDMAISGDGQTIYVLFFWSLVISTDGGSTWSIVNGLPDMSNWRVTGYYLNISCDSTGQYLYANHTGSITYISSNYGATWTTNSVLYSQNRNTPLQQSDTGIFFSGKQLYLSNQTAVDTAIANNMTPLPPSIIHGLSGGPLTIPGVGAIWNSTAANTPFTLTSLIPPPPPPPPSLPTHILDETMYPAPTTILLPSESFTSPPANINGGTYSIYDISGGVPENTITIDSDTGLINVPAGAFPSGGFFTVRVLNLSTSGIYTLGYLYFNIYQTIIYIHQADMDTISWPMTITDSLTLVNFAENLTLTSSNQYFIIGNNQITINGGGYKVTVNGVTNGYRGLVQNPSFNNITVQNISMGATSGSLLLTSTDPSVGSAGWIGQANYSGGENNQIINCVNGAPVYGAGVGGIMGSGAGQVGGTITFTKCTNNGSINGAGAGGIVGNNASNVVITTSRNMGPIQGALAGGIMGSGVSNSSLTNSFNRGSIGAGAAGLIGSTNLGPIPVTNCYSSGPLNGQGAQFVVGQDTNAAVQKRNLYTPNGQRYWSNTDADKFLTGTQGSVWSNLGAINPSSDSPYELSAILTIPDEALIVLNMYEPNSGDSYDNEPLVVTGPNPTLYADGSFSILWVSDGTNSGLGLTDPSFSIDPNTGEMVLTKDAFSVTSGLIIIVIQYTPNDASPVTIGVFYYTIHTILTIGQGDIYSAAWPWTLTGYTSVQFSENVSFNSNEQYFIVGGDAVTFDGFGHTVSFNNVPGYAGLIQNNEANLNTGSNYKNIVVQNISVKADTTSYLAAGAGWLGQTNFAGSNGIAQFISCYNTAPVADYCGGIVGSNCADNYGLVTFTQCSNTGVIGKSAGGICGPAAGSSSGSVSLLECYNQGAVGLESGLVASVDGRALSVSFNNCYSVSPDLVGQNGGLESITKTNCYNSASWDDDDANTDLSGVSLLGSGLVWTALGNNTPFLFLNQLSLVGHYQKSASMYSTSEIFRNNNEINVIAISDSFTGEFSILYISDGTSPGAISINSYGSVTIPAVAFTTLGPKTIYVGLSGDTNYIGYIHYTPLNYIFVDQAAVNELIWPQGLNEAYTKVDISGNIILSNSSQYFTIGADNVTIDGLNNTIDISGVYPGLVQNNGFKNATIQNIIIFSTDSMLMDGAGWIAQDGFNGKNNLIQYCNNSADITGVGCGGIVGQNVTDLSLNWCSNFGQISGQNCGGIVGQLAGIIDINGCSNAGSIEGRLSGGICGSYASRVKIYNSSNTGKIVANEAGGIIGAFAGYQSGLVELNQCYNIGEIVGLQAGGLCGSSSAYDKGEIIIRKSYNSGIGIGGFFGSISSDAYGIDLSECYNVGTIDLTTSGSEKITRTSTYSIKSADLWSDVSASLNGLAVPLTKPGSSTIWTSLKENTPFLLKSFLQLEEGVSANLSMYSSEPEINGIDNSGIYYTNSQEDGSYSIIHISDDTMIGISIDSTTGAITIDSNAFSTVGLKTIYVKEANYNQIGYFYYDVYNEVYRINNLTNLPEMTMNYTYISINSNITLTDQTITIGGDNVWIYGNGHTINFAGATDYPGLINNGSNAQVGFNNIIIQDIVVTADVTSSLAPNAGWLAQSYFGNRANGNRIDNCSSSAPISSVGCGGIAGAFCGNGGNLVISGCSNSGIMTSDSVGGIVGQYAAANGGILTVNQCSNMGAIQASNSAGIMSVKAGFASGSVTLDRCTNVGVVSGNDSAGLICNSGRQSLITVANSYSRDKMTSLMGTVDPLSQFVSFTNCYSLNSIVSNDTESIATNLNCYVAGVGGWSDSDAFGTLLDGPPIPGSGFVWAAIGFDVPFFLSNELTLPVDVSNNSNMYSPNTVENDSNSDNQSVMSGVGTGVYRVLYVSDGTNPASIVIDATSGQITLNSADFEIGTRTIYVLDTSSNSIGYLTYSNYNLFVDQTFINNMNGNYTVVEGTIINFINGTSMPVGQYLIAADDYITFDGSSIKVKDMGLTGIEFDYSIRIV